MPTLTERLQAALAAFVFGAPVSFVVWLVANLAFKAEGGVSMLLWVTVGIVLFVALGFVFPRAIGKKLKF